MSDKLTELVLGLQRMAENAHMRCQDLDYSQREERRELAAHLDQLLTWVDKLRGSLLEDRRWLEPANDRPRMKLAPEEQLQQIPRVVKQGPKEVAG